MGSKARVEDKDSDNVSARQPYNEKIIQSVNPVVNEKIILSANPVVNEKIILSANPVVNENTILSANPVVNDKIIQSANPVVNEKIIPVETNTKAVGDLMSQRMQSLAKEDRAPSRGSDKGVQVSSILLSKRSEAKFFEKEPPGKRTPELPGSLSLKTSSFNLQLSDLQRTATVQPVASQERTVRQVTSQTLNLDLPKSLVMTAEHRSPKRSLPERTDYPVLHQQPIPQKRGGLSSREPRNLLQLRLEPLVPLEGWSSVDDSSKFKSLESIPQHHHQESQQMGENSIVLEVEPKAQMRSESTLAANVSLPADASLNPNIELAIQHYDQNVHRTERTDQTYSSVDHPKSRIKLKKNVMISNEGRNITYNIAEHHKLYKSGATDSSVDHQISSINLKKNVMKTDEERYVTDNIAKHHRLYKSGESSIGQWDEFIVEPREKSSESLKLIGQSDENVKPTKKSSKKHKTTHRERAKLKEPPYEINDVTYPLSIDHRKSKYSLSGPDYAERAASKADTEFFQVDDLTNPLTKSKVEVIRKSAKSKQKSIKHVVPDELNAPPGHVTAENIPDHNSQDFSDQSQRLTISLYSDEPIGVIQDKHQTGIKRTLTSEIGIVHPDENDGTALRVTKKKKVVSGSKKVHKVTNSGEFAPANPELSVLPEDTQPSYSTLQSGMQRSEKSERVSKRRSKSKEPERINFGWIEPGLVMILPSPVAEQKSGSNDYDLSNEKTVTPIREQKDYISKHSKILFTDVSQYNALSHKLHQISGTRHRDFKSDRGTEKGHTRPAMGSHEELIVDNSSVDYEKKIKIRSDGKRVKSSRRNRDNPIDGVETLEKSAAAEIEEGGRYVVTEPYARLDDSLHQSPQKSSRVAIDNVRRYENAKVGNIFGSSPSLTPATITSTSVHIEPRPLYSEAFQIVSTDRRQKMHKVRLPASSHGRTILKSSMSESCIATQSSFVKAYADITGTSSLMQRLYMDERYPTSNGTRPLEDSRVVQQTERPSQKFKSQMDQKVKSQVDLVRRDEYLSTPLSNHVSRRRRKETQLDHTQSNNDVTEVPFDVTLQQLGLSEAV